MIGLEASSLTVRRGQRTVLEGVSFAIRAGEILVLTGPNGAGKSTLLRAVAGLLPFAGGTVLWQGEDRPIGEAAHYLGHLDALKPQLSVAENLALWSKVAGAPGLAPIEALERVGLDALADLPAAYLSAGQRRRAAFARLLTRRRPLWLLDEPTSALDAAAERGFGDLLGAHVAAGGLAIISTHRPLPATAAATLALGIAA